jgi:hypothetical protein
MGQNLKIAQQKRSFYGILPFAIVCTWKQNLCSLSKQGSFSTDENGWLHIVANINFGS